MNEWVDGGIIEWMNGRVHEWVNECVNQWIQWVRQWIHGVWMNECADEGMNDWMNESVQEGIHEWANDEVVNESLSERMRSSEWMKSEWVNAEALGGAHEWMKEGKLKQMLQPSKWPACCSPSAWVALPLSPPGLVNRAQGDVQQSPDQWYSRWWGAMRWHQAWRDGGKDWRPVHWQCRENPRELTALAGSKGKKKNEVVAISFSEPCKSGNSYYSIPLLVLSYCPHWIWECAWISIESQVPTLLGRRLSHCLYCLYTPPTTNLNLAVKWKTIVF